VNYSYELPGYAKDDWLRDWGSLELYALRPNSQGQTPDVARIDRTTKTRWGWWSVDREVRGMYLNRKQESRKCYATVIIVVVPHEPG